MARYKAAVESLAALGAGVNATTTLNGYFAALIAGASANLKLRRVILGVRATTPTSQNITIAFYRQTTRAAGTGIATTAGINLDPRGPTSPQSPGVDAATATTVGTTAPVLGAQPLDRITFNTMASVDLPFDYLEEFFVDQGSANGLAFVNIGAALPASHLITLDLEWEE